MPLALHLKSSCHTQVHLGFLLCYILGVLQFFILHLGLWFGVRSVSKFTIFSCIRMSSFSSIICPKDSWFCCIRDQLTIFMCIYFWALYSILFLLVLTSLSQRITIYFLIFNAFLVFILTYEICKSRHFVVFLNYHTPRAEGFSIYKHSINICWVNKWMNSYIRKF